jgi:hypothetical protein
MAHKVFVSYYHHDDEKWRRKWDILFGDLFINKSVEPGDIDTDNSAEYIKRLIRENYLEDTSVLVVLIGKNTWSRKHVDWEISAALNKKVGGYSGLLGLLLPSHPDFGNKKFNPHLIPIRLYDNIHSGYAKLYDWTEDRRSISQRVARAFDRRITEAIRIVNDHPQFKHNKPKPS